MPLVYGMCDFSDCGFIIITSLLREMQKGKHPFKLPMLSNSYRLLLLLSAGHFVRQVLVVQWGMGGQAGLRRIVDRPAAYSMATVRTDQPPGDSTSSK